MSSWADSSQRQTPPPAVPHQLAESPPDKVQHRPEIQLAGDLLADGPDGLKLLGAGPQFLLGLLASGDIVKCAVYGEESAARVPRLPSDGSDPNVRAVLADCPPFPQALRVGPGLRATLPARLRGGRREEFAEGSTQHLAGLVTEQRPPCPIDGKEPTLRIEDLIWKGDVFQSHRNFGRAGVWPVGRGVGALRPTRGAAGRTARLAATLQWLRLCARHVFLVRARRDQCREVFRVGPVNPNR